MLRKTLTSLGLAVVAGTLIAGCATNGMAKQKQISIERVDSSSVNVGHAYIDKTADGLTLRGEVKRKIHSHGKVSGHLHVELINPQGQVLKTAEVNHNRKASSDHIADFSTLLPMELAPGSVVRIIHHDMKSHMSDASDSQWKDVTE